MTNDELDKAIDTAAKHACTAYGNAERGTVMLKQLQALLEIQLKRAKEEEKHETKS